MFLFFYAGDNTVFSFNRRASHATRPLIGANLLKQLIARVLDGVGGAHENVPQLIQRRSQNRAEITGTSIMLLPTVLQQIYWWAKIEYLCHLVIHLRKS